MLKRLYIQFSALLPNFPGAILSNNKKILISTFTAANVETLLALSNRYQILALKHRCEAHLLNCVEIPTVDRLQLADMYELDKLAVGSNISNRIPNNLSYFSGPFNWQKKSKNPKIEFLKTYKGNLVVFKRNFNFFWI